MQNTFRALKSKNYRIFAGGQAISRIGTWMERTAVSWIVYDMTHSAFMLGLTIFVSQFPSFLLSFYGGIVSDKYNRHKIVIITQILSMIQAFILAAIVLLGVAEIWSILLLITILGVINAFDVPARQSLIDQLVESSEDLSNAVALNSSIVNIARLVGPALSGLILVTWGAGLSFFINGVSYFAVIISLFSLKLNPQEYLTRESSTLDEIKEALNYLKDKHGYIFLAFYIALVSLLVMPFDTLLPEFAKDIFQGNARTYGYMYSCMGFGALVGAISLASMKGKSKYLNILLTNVILLGVGLIIFSFIRSLPIALLINAILGATAFTQITICLTIIQIHSSSNMKGRMISLMTTSSLGMLPLGSLLIGFISHHIGGPHTILIQGIIAITIGISFIKLFKINSSSKIS